MPRSLLALGSNLGDRQAILERACAEIDASDGCKVVACSTWHGTVPIGGAEGQGDFLNGAVLVETTLSPQELSLAMQTIETGLGRQRVVRWDARAIDIDILLYEQQVIDTDELTVPHPRMGFRLFVLEPAVEIAADMQHPTSGWTLSALLKHLHSSPRYVVVAAVKQLAAEELAKQLRDLLGCRWEPNADSQTSTMDRRRIPVSLSGSGVQFPASDSGHPPVVTTCSFDTLRAMPAFAEQHPDWVRPALVIVLDHSKTVDKTVDWRNMGPLARITTQDPATVLQEAAAAVRCVWPDIAEIGSKENQSE